MGFFNNFPYTNFHELNLDYILKKVAENEEFLKNYTSLNKITYGGEWNIEKSYTPWTVVTDGDTCYISVKPVPAGVQLSNEDYWIKAVQYAPDVDTPAHIIRVINAVKYGVDNSGKTDITDTLTNILYNADSGSVICFDSGNYLVSGEIHLTKPVTIYGLGNVNFICETGCFDITSENVTVQGVNFTAGKAVTPYAIQVRSRYCNIRDIHISDTRPYYFDCAIIDGSSETGSWFNAYENVYINKDITTEEYRGTGIKCVGSVNNTYSNIFIARKNIGIHLPDVVATDRPDKHYVDGMQMSLINMVWCNYGIDATNSSAVLINNSIIDQIQKSALVLRRVVNAKFDFCWFGFSPEVVSKTAAAVDTAFFTNFNNCVFYCNKGTQNTALNIRNGQYCNVSKCVISYFKQGIILSGYSNNVDGCTFNECESTVTNSGTRSFTQNCYPPVMSGTNANRCCVTSLDVAITNTSQTAYIPTPFQANCDSVFLSVSSPDGVDCRAVLDSNFEAANQIKIQIYSQNTGITVRVTALMYEGA